MKKEDDLKINLEPNRTTKLSDEELASAAGGIFDPGYIVECNTCGQLNQIPIPSKELSDFLKKHKSQYPDHTFEYYPPKLR